MIALRLVHLIENHCDELAESLQEKVHHSVRTREFRKVPPGEFRDRSREVYRNLNDWLVNKTEHEIEKVYKPLGARRAEQGVSLGALCWAIILIKENLWDFLEREGLHGGAEQVYGELELLRHLGRFFDRAIYYAVEGYVEARKPKEVVAA
jgi:hypothetical protein